MKKSQTQDIPATALTIRDRYVARYPNLATVARAQDFCHAALLVESPQGTTYAEVFEMTELAHGRMPASIVDFDKLSAK